jgi:NACHT domain
VTRSEEIFYTDSEGFYRAAPLEPDYYTVEAFHSGFESAARRDLNVRSGARVHLDLELASSLGSTWWSWSLPGAGTVGFLVLTTFFTLLVTETGRGILQGPKKLGKWGRDKGYQLLASRFPNRIGLPGYRTRVLRDPFLGRIECPVGSEDFQLPLDQAFTPLAVYAANGDEDAPIGADLFEFAAGHNRFVVLGGPGTGKTTLMKNLVLSILRGHCHRDLDVLIPVFVLLRDMASAAHTVEEAIVAALERFRFKKPEHFVASALDSGRFLVILDGLDEVGVSREAISEKIRQFCLTDVTRDQPNHIIVTCRENSYRTRDLADVIPSDTRIEPFSAPHMKRFLQQWPPYNGRFALTLYPQIQGDPQLKDICRNPLLLTLLVGLFLQTERFELPSSRRAFYEASLDELLSQRPARKSQHQDYGDSYKRQILQCVALDRLETVQHDEDPELLSRARLFDCAKQALGADFKEADFQKLLHELETINSIIKPSDKERVNYLFAHRTFQEYLAACEAHRTRKNRDVISLCLARPELAELLCFYCGLIPNIPQILAVLTKLVEAGNSLLGGRCLMNVAAGPAQGLRIEGVVEALAARIRKTLGYTPELDVLSSLAQRTNPVFEIARQRFSEMIQLIAGKSTEGLPGFVSALSGNPELGWKVIPGLLNHESADWRAQGVLLQHNLGSDEAVFRLLQLVDSGGQPERALAGSVVAGLIRSHNVELKARASILRDRPRDAQIWPFEQYFPGRLAVAILDAWESAKGIPRVPGIPRNPCIDVAFSIHRHRADGSLSKKDSRHWAHVGRAIKSRTRIRRVLKGWRYAALAILGLWIGTQLCLLAVCSAKNQVALIEFWPPKIIAVSAQPQLIEVAAAQRLYSELAQRYPFPSGWALLRFWKWDLPSRVPRELSEAAKLLQSYQPWPLVNARLFLNDRVLSIAVSPVAVASFQNARSSAERNLPRPSARAYFWVLSLRAGQIAPRAYLLFWFFLFLVFSFSFSGGHGIHLDKGYWPEFGFLSGSLILSFTLSVNPIQPPAPLILEVLSILLPPLSVWGFMAAFVLVPNLARRVDFPRNPFIKLADELGPLAAESGAIT